MINYVESKDGYSGRRWFTDDPADEEPWVLDPENFDINKLNNDSRIMILAYKALKYYDKLPERKLTLDNFPVFKQPKISFLEMINYIIAPIVILLIYGGMLFFIIFRKFDKYNPVS